MIPPVVPGQTEEQNMVGWKNTFNMRQVTIMNLAASQIGARNGIKHDPKSYINHGCITNPIKSLDILRKNIQNAVNKDIDCIIKKYLDKFFQPAVNNIRQNQGRDSINEEHVKLMCRKMLEDAKTMYKASNVSRDSSPHEYSDSDPGGYFESRFSLLDRKRKESDTDSESTTISKSQKRHKNKDWEEIAKLPVKREAPKWNPDRLNPRTLFIMGARANKVLGFSQTRGRLYVRHPELIRYAGDQEDKEWLTSKYLMPTSGGKAYIMIFDDVRELAMSEEYKNNPNLRLHELKGFEAPSFLLNKIRLYMERMRTDKKCLNSSVELFDFHQSVQSVTSPLDSAPSTPSDTLHESQSASTTSSKHSENNFVNIPEISPSSNNSLMSGQLTQSPIPSSSSLLSPNLLMGIGGNEGQGNNGSLMVLRDNHHQNESCLSSLLASHMSSDNSQDF